MNLTPEHSTGWRRNVFKEVEICNNQWSTLFASRFPCPKFIPSIVPGIFPILFSLQYLLISSSLSYLPYPSLLMPPLSLIPPLSPFSSLPYLSFLPYLSLISPSLYVLSSSIANMFTPCTRNDVIFFFSSSLSSILGWFLLRGKCRGKRRMIMIKDSALSNVNLLDFCGPLVSVHRSLRLTHLTRWLAD